MHAVVNGRFEDWPEVHRNRKLTVDTTPMR